MNIIVTGGAGFIASHIVDRLIDEKHSVIVIDNLSTGKVQNINPNATFYHADICSPYISLIFKEHKPDIVIHHAAQTDVNHSLKVPNFDAKNNILGSINVFGNTVKYKAKQVIYASSAAVYGEPQYLGIDENHPLDPLSFYGLSKYIGEKYLQTYSKIYGIKYTILRYSNVYGPRQKASTESGVVTAFINNLLQTTSPTIYGNGEQTRDFIYVADVVEANIKAISNSTNEIINIGSGIPITINNLLKEIANYIDHYSPPTYKPERKGDIKHSYFNILKAKEILGWNPSYSLTEGLNKTVNFYKSNLKEGGK